MRILFFFFTFITVYCLADEVIDILPKDVAMVSRIDFKKVRELPGLKEEIAKLKKLPQIEILKLVKLHPENINTCYFAARVKDSKQKPEGIMILKTAENVELPGIAAMLGQTQKVQVENKTVGKHSIYLLKAKGHPTLAFAKISDGMACAGSDKLVIEIIENFQGKKKNKIANAKLLKLTEQFQKDSPLMWMAACEDPGIKKSRIKSVSGLFDFNKTFVVDVKLTAANEKVSKSIKEAMNYMSSAMLLDESLKLKENDVIIKEDALTVSMRMNLQKEFFGAFMEKSLTHMKKMKDKKNNTK